MRKSEGEKKIPYPEGFCAAFSYVPSHGFYASSAIKDFDFNFLLAKALLAPTEGTDWRVMDGHPSMRTSTTGTASYTSSGAEQTRTRC